MGVVEGDEVVLVEDGVARRLEEDVGKWIALFEFEADFFGEVVVGVFGFPNAVHEGEVVDEGSVGSEGVACPFL